MKYASYASFLTFLLSIYLAVQLMYKAGWKGPTTRVSYCIAVLGLVLTIFATNPRIRYIGITLFVASCALFAGFRYTFWYSISEMMKPILNDNLKDIGETFRMKPIISDRGRKTGEYVPSGKSGFWVAEAYEESSDIDDPRTEVIGCVGLCMLRCPGCRSVTRSNCNISMQMRIILLTKPVLSSVAW